MIDKPLVNKVANSGIKTIDLEEYFPKAELVDFDIKHYLFKELLLKEKDFRIAMKEFDWSKLEGKVLLVYCSSDAIIPMWAYMLIAASARTYASDVFLGSKEEYFKLYYRTVLSAINGEDFKGERVVIKGCGDKPVPAFAYSEITQILQPWAQSIMFGEPCSTVPIFKRPRDLSKS